MNIKPNQRDTSLVYLVTEDWYFVSHRLLHARAAIAAGYRVYLITKISKYKDLLLSEGIKLVDLNVHRGSLGLFSAFFSFVSLIKAYKFIRPDIVHHVGMKPIILGSLAACFLKIGFVVNAFGGLGYIFTSTKSKAFFLRSILWALMRLKCFSRMPIYVVQNPDDQHVIEKFLRLSSKKILLIPGAGVDTTRYFPSPLSSGPISFALVSRLLLDKGVLEFISAAREVKKIYPKTRFILAGDVDVENPASILRKQIGMWCSEGVVEHWGYINDVPSLWAKCQVCVLPSYREGLPRSLLEAAACGRPIITTNVPGCRSVVEHGLNGILVPPKQVTPLVDAMKIFIEDRSLMQEYGNMSRKLVESKFSNHVIIPQFIDLYRGLVK